MKLFLAAILTASCAAVALPAAAADNQWLASVEYSQHQFSNSGPSPSVVSAQLDYRSSKYWGFEFEGGSGVINNKGVAISTDIAGYATATLPVGSSVDLFARGGYGFLSYNAGGRANANYWAAGVGADVWIDKGLGVRVDYSRQIINKSVPDANVYAVGLVHRF